MTKDEVSIIAKSIKTAIVSDVPEFYFETGLMFRNGRHMLKWDYIFDNIANELATSSLRVVKNDRGIFTMALIIDEEERALYSIMTEKNLRLIRKNKNKGHYLYAFASINKGMEAQQEQQSLFDNINEEQVSYEEYLMQTVGFIPSLYKTFLIDDSNKSKPVISLAIINENLEVVKQDIIQDNKGIEYTLIDNDKSIDVETQTIPLALKKSALARINNGSNVAIIEETREKNKEG